MLAEVKGNRSRAAEVLAIDRRTLYRMAERFGIDLGEEPSRLESDDHDRAVVLAVAGRGGRQARTGPRQLHHLVADRPRTGGPLARDRLRQALPDPAVAVDRLGDAVGDKQQRVAGGETLRAAPRSGNRPAGPPEGRVAPSSR